MVVLIEGKHSSFFIKSGSFVVKFFISLHNAIDKPISQVLSDFPGVEGRSGNSGCSLVAA